MENESTSSFDALVVYRQQLQQFCFAHYSSLMIFQKGVSFKLNLDEKGLGRKPRHLSSSATCIESLLDCPDGLPHKDSLKQLATQFAILSLQRSDQSWKSDGSAHIYCRCRTLPLVTCHLPNYDGKVEQHLIRILNQLNKDASRLAIGEAWGETEKNWYPPNAFHTCWTLQVLHDIEEKFPKAFIKICDRFRNTRFNIGRIREEMLLWAKQTAGYQMALHASQSSTLDSDQLAWSLAILMKFDRDFQANLAQQDFIRHGLKCLFEEQTSTGIWRTGAPLFHYLKSGNAYCYVFETFSVLLKSVLTDRKEGVFLRHTLRPYVGHLIKLWRYARSTEIPLSGDGKLVGWSSGHRVNRKEPESWATASVYCFSQCLRRLIGIWAREAAAEQLRVSSGRRPEADPVETLSQRGDTWTTERKTNGKPEPETAASQLMTLFVNPTRYFDSGNKLEPDGQPIDQDQARAAILFGPPGTSKTTLSSCVADAIGWDYVELHASHFVAEGLPNVQRTANKIFEKLLQLDRTVILFDEIDELVRSRGMEVDAFGRFLTTSMLPKLAELWKLRKVIYFVATNHIGFFDPAVTRPQRFDTLVHVPPPSFQRKLDELKRLLAISFDEVKLFGLASSDVETALQNAVKKPTESSPKTSPDESSSKPMTKERQLPPTCMLAKLLLMRWDQLQELASIIRRRRAEQKSVTLNRKLLESALAELSDPWLQKCEPFIEYLESGRYEQHDFSKVKIWEVRGSVPDACKLKFRRKLDGSDGYWHVSKAPFGDLSDFPCRYAIVAPGVVKCRK